MAAPLSHAAIRQNLGYTGVPPLILRSSPEADVSKDAADIDSEAPYRAEAAG